MLGASIMARLGLDSAPFKRGLAEAGGLVSRFGSGFASAISVAALSSAVRGLVEYGDRIQDLSERYRVNAESLQRLGNIAETEGSSLEGVGQAFNKLAINSSQALQGNREMIKAFADLGVTTDDLRSLSPEEIMLKIGRGSMEASDLVKVLGKSALELVPTLEKLGDGTVKFGDAISAIDIKKLAEADDLFKKIWQTVRITAGTNLAQTFTLFKTETWKEHFREMGSSVDNFFKVIGYAARGNISAAKQALLDLKKTTEDAFNTINRGEVTGSPLKAAGEMAGRLKRAGAEAEQPGTLSIKELAEHGAQPGTSFGQGLRGFRGTQATGTIQAIWAAQQAREALKLEEDAKRVDLTGISPTGETAEGLRNRAHDIRQNIPGLQDSDKLKTALKTTEETLSKIEANTKGMFAGR